MSFISNILVNSDFSGHLMLLTFHRHEITMDFFIIHSISFHYIKYWQHSLSADNDRCDRNWFSPKYLTSISLLLIHIFTEFLLSARHFDLIGDLENNLWTKLLLVVMYIFRVSGSQVDLDWPPNFTSKKSWTLLMHLALLHNY